MNASLQARTTSRASAHAAMRSMPASTSAPRSLMDSQRAAFAPLKKQSKAASARAIEARVAQPTKRVWQSYCNSLETNPTTTKAGTSFVGFVLGGILAQRLEGSTVFDVERLVNLGLYGLLLDGPVGHIWYKWLDGWCDEQFANPKGAKAVAFKTAADQIVWAPVMTCVFFAFLKLLEGHPEEMLPVIQEKVLPTVAANYVIWPAAHVISFKFVPSSQRILYNNVIAIFWNCYLSIVAAGSQVDVDALSGDMQAQVDALQEVAASVKLAASQTELPDLSYLWDKLGIAQNIPK